MNKITNDMVEQLLRRHYKRAADEDHDERVWGPFSEDTEGVLERRIGGVSVQHYFHLPATHSIVLTPHERIVREATPCPDPGCEGCEERRAAMMKVKMS